MKEMQLEIEDYFFMEFGCERGEGKRNRDVRYEVGIELRKSVLFIFYSSEIKFVLQEKDGDVEIEFQ